MMAVRSPGYFTIGPYGYLNAPVDLITTIGTTPTPFLNGQSYTLRLLPAD